MPFNFMNYLTHQEKLTALHSAIKRRLESSKEARNKAAKKSPQHLMLCGKAKAYLDCLMLIENKYGKDLL